MDSHYPEPPPVSRIPFVTRGRMAHLNRALLFLHPSSQIQDENCALSVHWRQLPGRM